MSDENINEFTLLGVLAEIRQKTGVGDKPMLSKLADVLALQKSENMSLRSSLSRISILNERFFLALRALTTPKGHLPHPNGKCTPECKEVMSCLEAWKAPDSNPSCFKSRPSAQAVAENGCDDCRVQLDCLGQAVAPYEK